MQLKQMHFKNELFDLYAQVSVVVYFLSCFIRPDSLILSNLQLEGFAYTTSSNCQRFMTMKKPKRKSVSSDYDYFFY